MSKNIYNIDNINPNNKIFNNTFVHTQSGLIFSVTKNGYQIDDKTFTIFPEFINYLSEQTGIYYKTILANFFLNINDNTPFTKYFF